MCSRCGYEEIIERIDDLLLDERATRKHEFLGSMRDTIEGMGHATPRQIEVLEEIEDEVEDGE